MKSVKLTDRTRNYAEVKLTFRQRTRFMLLQRHEISCVKTRGVALCDQISLVEKVIHYIEFAFVDRKTGIYTLYLRNRKACSFSHNSDGGH